MKALKIIVIVIVAIFAIFLVLGIVAPKDFEVNRSVVINAPKDVIYEHVSNLKKMDEWSPWSKKDTNMIQSYEGTDGTVGSIAKWEGNEEVGKGMQEITALEQNKRVDTKLTFLEPWEAESSAYVELEDAEEGGVKVTWGFKGHNPFPWNAMTLFMDMDAAVGKDFEEGLGNLKTMAESAVANANVEYMGYKIMKTELPMATYVMKKDTVKWADMSNFFMENFGPLFGAIGASGQQPAGAPSGLYYTWDEENQQTLMAAAIPVAGEGNIDGYETTHIGGKALQIVYFGSYSGSEDAHNALNGYIQENGMEINGPVVEQYITDPETEPDTSKWQTNIFYLVK